MKRIVRRRSHTKKARCRVRDDAYRVHEALDELRATFHAAEPGLIALGRSFRRVRRSLDGTGTHIVELGRAILRDIR